MTAMDSLSADKISSKNWSYRDQSDCAGVEPGLTRPLETMGKQIADTGSGCLLGIVTDMPKAELTVI